VNPTIRALLAVSLGLLLTACPKTTRPPPKPTEPTVPAPAPTVDLRGATLYEVSAKDSDVRILVYRAGTLSRLGHNHVMTAAGLTGRVWINPALAKSGLELSFPVEQLVVDDPAARKASGDEFPPDIPAADREGTRKNMLRAEVLDSERFRDIKLTSVKVSGTQSAPQIRVRVTIKDASREIDVPVKVAIEGSRLTASGEFELKQTDFGIKPFSVGLGTLQVKDELKVGFKVVAVKK
jgi:polyisoprenoid-binding protein YceI